MSSLLSHNHSWIWINNMIEKYLVSGLISYSFSSLTPINIWLFAGDVLPCLYFYENINFCRSMMIYHDFFFLFLFAQVNPISRKYLRMESLHERLKCFTRIWIKVNRVQFKRTVALGIVVGVGRPVTFRCFRFFPINMTLSFLIVYVFSGTSLTYLRGMKA